MPDSTNKEDTMEQTDKPLPKKELDRNRRPEQNRPKTIQAYKGNVKTVTRSNRSQGRGRG